MTTPDAGKLPSEMLTIAARDANDVGTHGKTFGVKLRRQANLRIGIVGLRVEACEVQHDPIGANLGLTHRVIRT